MRFSNILVTTALLAACNQHPVSVRPPLGELEFSQSASLDEKLDLDILWVIDNSGSMCEEQQVLRENFDRFIDEIDGAAADFHIAVTTTHMVEDPNLPEPVAVPGRLQSMPQPIPGFDRSCWTATDAAGENIEGDYAPIRAAIQAALDCLAEPDARLAALTDDEIACAVEGLDGCSISGVCGVGECEMHHLFPQPSQYRAIPKVLRSADYTRSDGTLDSERLRTDFACMATVGTRGHGFERGLAAAVAAVSPELTGGQEDDSAPNHGFIRPDARFGVIFVTDENDCSDDGSLSERAGSCGAEVCEFFNHPDAVDSPLVAPEDFHARLVENLAATKGRDRLFETELFAASIHGNSRRYDGDIVTGPECRVRNRTEPIAAACGALDICRSDQATELVQPTCATSLGRAYSGDRYDRFLRTFGDGQFFPPAVDETTPLTGWLCSGDFQPALQAIGDLLVSAPSGCVTQPIAGCGADSACPDHADGSPGACVQRPGGAAYCDSYLQLRFASERTEVLENLRQTGLCIPDESAPEPSCIVSRDVYQLDSCGGAVDGIRVRWADEERVTSNFEAGELQLRWRAH